MYFILPLSLYAFLPVRSLQGYGNVTTLKGFFYYITGRYTTGEVHGGSFFDKDLANFISVAKEFFIIIYRNFGPVLLLIALAGLVYLFKKDIKFAVCSLVFILFNLVIITQFIGWAPQNHILFSMTVITIYISMGFLVIYDLCKNLLLRLEKKHEEKLKKDTSSQPDLEIINNKSKNNNAATLLKITKLKYVLSSVLLAAFLISPALLAAGNYRMVDRSSPEEIYLFWNRIFDRVENGSSIFVSSLSANIGIFIAEYEQQEKNISIIQNEDPEYNLEKIREKLNSKTGVYFIGVEDFLIPFLNLKKLDSYRWPRFGEDIIFYNVTSEKKQLEILPADTELNVRFGDIFSVEYKIINQTGEDVLVNSLELALPAGAGFIEVDKAGSINQQPGISQGKYMWVKNYTVEAKSALNLILKLRAQAPGQSLIKFRVTSQDIYMDSPDISLSIKE